MQIGPRRGAVKAKKADCSALMAGISLCFVGCGAMNARHVRLFKRLRPGSAFAVASRDRRESSRFWRALGAKDCFGSYDEALASGYDGLVIGTPPRGHAALIEAALAAGKHLLIEKPVVARFDELERLWPALKRSGRTVMVAENLHYAPFHRRLKERLRDPAAGTAADSRLDPARAFAPHRLAGRPRRDAARRAARGGRPLDPAPAGPGVGVRAEPRPTRSSTSRPPVPRVRSRPPRARTR